VSSTDCGGFGGGPKLGAGGATGALGGATDALGAAGSGSAAFGGGLSSWLTGAGGDAGPLGRLGSPGFDAAQAAVLAARRRNM
jgi:hypothetical protein